MGHQPVSFFSEVAVHRLGILIGTIKFLAMIYRDGRWRGQERNVSVSQFGFGASDGCEC